MAYNTIIFDLDGTLLNTLEDLKDGVNYALDKLGQPARTLNEVREFIGNGVEKLIDQAVLSGTSPEDTAKCLAIFREFYANNMQNKTCPYRGILELLKELNKQNYKLAIVSNKFDTAVKALCKDYFSEFIQVAIGDSPNSARKPAPDSVYTALKELNSTPEQAIYVGDSEVDVYTAHNAGLPCVSVTWGFRSRILLESVGADILIDQPDELLNCLAKLNQS
jgi:phosphoglycolate phosphatase